MNKVIIIIIFLTLSLSLVASQNIYDNCNIYGNCIEPITFDNNTAFVNESSHWVTTSLGTLSDASDTQFNSPGGVLTIDTSWLQFIGDSFWCALTGCTMQGDIDMDNNNILGVNTLTNGYTIINQKADAQGLKIFGFDDRSSNYLDLSIDSSGQSTMDVSTSFIIEIQDVLKYFIGADTTTIRTDMLMDQDHSIFTRSDTAKNYFGAADDASIYYDGTNMRIDPRNVGVGALYVNTHLSVFGQNGVSAGFGAQLEAYKATGDARISIHEDSGTGTATLHFRVGGDDWEIINDGNSFKWENEDHVLFELAEFIAGGHMSLPNDNQKLFFGGAGDASTYYDGTHMVFDSQEVGTGDFVFLNGNMGVGNNNPAFKLSVKDHDNIISMEFDGAAGGALFRFKAAGVPKGYIGWSGAGDDGISFWNAAGTVANMLMTDDGRLGIGTTVPTEKLEVNGNLFLSNDNDKLFFGAAKDASITYDGSNMVINPKEVGTGNLKVVGDLNVTGSIHNTLAHAHILVTDIGTVAQVDTWYNLTANISLVDSSYLSFLEDNVSLEVEHDGHYTVTYGMGVIDVSPSPNADVAMRLTVNGVEVVGSYIESDTTRQNSDFWFEHTTHTEFFAGDEIRFEYISSDTDVTIEQQDTYATQGFNAYIYVQEIII